jgi:hypothetical protein
VRPPPGTDRESGILLRDGALIDWQPPMGACQLEAPTTSRPTRERTATEPRSDGDADDPPGMAFRIRDWTSLAPELRS